MNLLRVASAVVASAGLIVLAIGYFLLQNRLGMVRKWIPVEAEVLRAWMDERHTGDSTNESTSYTAHYELRFVVNGKSIVSTAASEDLFPAAPAEVRKRLDRHGPGTRATVYTDPQDPKQVRVNFGRNVYTLALPLWLLLAGASLLSFGISLWLMGTPTVFW